MSICPNCGSLAFTETVLIEACSACGLFLNYSTGAMSPTYEAFSRRKAEEEEEEKYKKQLDVED